MARFVRKQIDHNPISSLTISTLSKSYPSVMLVLSVILISLPCITLADSKSDTPSSNEDRGKTRPPSLDQLFAKIDSNEDNVLDSNELNEWMNREYKTAIGAQIENEFTSIDSNEDEKVTWNEYVVYAFGANKNGEIDAKKFKPEEFEEIKSSMQHDLFRFKSACQLNEEESKNCDETKGDIVLGLAEFQRYAIPDLYPEMHPAMVDVVMFDLDVDGDGVLTVDEYITAVSLRHKKEAEARKQQQQAKKTPNAQGGEGEEDDDDLDISEEDLRREYEYFFSHRDENKDGLMDYEEILNWVIPPHRQQPLGTFEAQQLFEKFDKNEDSKLSMDELVENATSFIRHSSPSYFVTSSNPPKSKSPNKDIEQDDPKHSSEHQFDGASEDDFEEEDNEVDHIEL